MKRIAILLLCVAMLMSVTACKKSKDTGLYTPTTTTTTGEPADPTYALDPVINRFFVDLLAKYGDDVMDVQSIRRAPGTDSTKPEDLIKEYLAVIDGLNISVRNASYTAQPEGQDPYEVYLLRVSIEGGNTTAARDKMVSYLLLTFENDQLIPILNQDLSDEVNLYGTRAFIQEGYLYVLDSLVSAPGGNIFVFDLNSAS